MAYGHRTPHQARQGATIVLLAARGRSNARIAAQTRMHSDTVRTWRGWFAVGGLPALSPRARWRCTGLRPRTTEPAPRGNGAGRGRSAVGGSDRAVNRSGSGHPRLAARAAWPLPPGISVDAAADGGDVVARRCPTRLSSR
ncbi:helix-turn-helix domain-containing protein [Streptomyces sp. NPDC046237]|uniref:helix-turn-helix domain-containing protein n=1 Tax=Streptomyces sp. NPDC046237 TaxID=3154914 RepID=UPI0033FA2FF6